MADNGDQSRKRGREDDIYTDDGGDRGNEQVNEPVSGNRGRRGGAYQPGGTDEVPLYRMEDRTRGGRNERTDGEARLVRRRLNDRVVDFTDVDFERDNRGAVVNLAPREGSGLTARSNFITGAPGHVDANMAVSNMFTQSGRQNYADAGQLAARYSDTGRILTLNIPVLETEDPSPFTNRRYARRLGQRPEPWTIDDAFQVERTIPSRHAAQRTQPDGQNDLRDARPPPVPRPVVVFSCVACHSNEHRTKNCPRPSKEGDTVICPIHNRSAVYGRTHSTHIADAPAGNHAPGWEPCRVLAHSDLAAKFGWLCVGRIGLPPVRVYSEDMCFISIILRLSREQYNDQMPLELNGRWPLLKSDAQVPANIDLLRRPEATGLGERPRSSLDLLPIQEIRRRYEAKELPIQVCRVPPPLANVDRESEHGGDFILAIPAEQPNNAPLVNTNPPANPTTERPEPHRREDVLNELGTHMEPQMANLGPGIDRIDSMSEPRQETDVGAAAQSSPGLSHLESMPSPQMDEEGDIKDKLLQAEANIRRPERQLESEQQRRKSIASQEIGQAYENEALKEELAGQLPLSPSTRAIRHDRMHTIGSISRQTSWSKLVAEMNAVMNSFEPVLLDEELDNEYLIDTLTGAISTPDTRSRFRDFLQNGPGGWFCVESVTENGHAASGSQVDGVCSFSTKHERECVRMRRTRGTNIIEFTIASPEVVE